ncbi:MAG: hypothetical protein PHP45_10545 [Elusimicrobiales bacterium]|nr:hypothetical protein [Elusimicrobiales bacterium]
MMKKSMLALAVSAMFASAVSAQKDNSISQEKALSAYNKSANSGIATNGHTKTMDKPDKPVKRARKTTGKPLDCDNPQSIRDFKDVILGTLFGTMSGQRHMKQVNEWTGYICGAAGAKAGFNNPLPQEPRSVPKMPQCRKDWSAQQCAQVLAEEYFNPNLLLTDEQSRKLSLGVAGEYGCK